MVGHLHSARLTIAHRASSLRGSLIPGGGVADNWPFFDDDEVLEPLKALHEMLKAPPIAQDLVT